jgi:hypothetical protein
MSTAIYLRIFILALAITWLPLAASASHKRPITTIATKITWQDKKDKKQEPRKENKKPEVKEVPQSRKQGKPEEVKPQPKERPQPKDKRKN